MQELYEHVTVRDCIAGCNQQRATQVGLLARPVDWHTILVSHRFSTVRIADLIVVLDGARVVEVGSHLELVAKGGTYAKLYGIQATAYAVQKVRTSPSREDIPVCQ